MNEPPQSAGGASRRQFLFSGALAGLGAATALGTAGAVAAAEHTAASDSDAEREAVGTDTYPFYGTHQAGIATPAPAHSTFIALTLKPDVDREGLARLMRVLSDDAARLTQGRGALADTEPELAQVPARLTITFGFGPEFVRRAEGEVPTWLKAVPPMQRDELEEAWSHGDLLIIVATDDPITLSHAMRMLLKDARAFADVRWIQRGFLHARGTMTPGTTPRNLFGQLDGTVNATVGTPEFAAQMWIDSGWATGGTGVVIRRIRMHLDSWDIADPAAREHAMGRRIGNGAPLTGENEHDEPDFDATTASGFPVINEFAHVRRARPDDPNVRIVRRAYNYEDPLPPGTIGERGIGTDAGLIFVAFAKDLDAQYVPIQQRLDEGDILNEWITHIGSATFVLPPGCAEGGFVGETLLS